MARSFALKMRGRMSSHNRIKKSTPELRRLEKSEEKLEKISEEVLQGIEKIEDMEENIEKHQKNKSWVKSELHTLSEFSWIKGEFSTLMFQDIVGASFGAVFFVVTQEIWNLAESLSWAHFVFIFITSFMFGFFLVYFSRRRRSLSEKLHQTVFLRTFEIYITSFAVSVVFLFMFGIHTQFDELLLRQSILVAMPAVISAATADLLFY